MSEVSFTGFRQMATWMITSKAGARFLAWFLTKYAREIMSTEVGSKFHDWVVSRAVMPEDVPQRDVIVVETFDDGFIRVHTANKNLRVSFVHRLKVATVQAEILDEERCSLNLGQAQRKVYNEQFVFIDNRSLHPSTVGELLQQQAKKDLYGMVDRIGKRNLSKDGSDRKSVPS